MFRPGSYISGIMVAVVVLCSGCGHHWREEYAIDDDNPFDLYVLHQLLSARPAGLTTLEDSLTALYEVDGAAANYVFIGQYAYYNERDVTQLLDFVERGNTAFIAASELPKELAEQLYGSDCFFVLEGTSDLATGSYGDGPGYRDTVQLTLEASEDPYELVNISYWKPSTYRHAYVPEHFLCDPELENRSIGSLDTNFIGFVELPWGEGKFYYNTLPKYFTNYYLVDSTWHHYAEDALAMAVTAGPVYWDEGSRVPPAIARQRQQGGRQNIRGRNLLSGNEALSYIQRQPALAFAWYLIIGGALLFVLFRGKRRQRIIPLIRQRENSSKRFIDTLSRLIFQKGHHGSLARQEIRSLRFYLQDRYGIRWQAGEPLPENFAELTGAAPELVERANIELKIIRDKPYIDESALVNFYRAIQPLYRLSTHKA